MNNKTMTEGTPWKHILYFALPVLLGSLLQQLYNTVDTIIVGNFASEEALSAVGTTGSFTFLFLAIATGFSAGNGVVVAQYFSAGDEKRVRENASTGIIMLLGMGILSTVLGILIARPAYSPFFGYSIVWWNGLFGFSLGCMISWSYYLSGKWQKNAMISGLD